MSTKKITKKEFLDWIFEQPDDRVFDLSEIKYDSLCGCPMVQYARDKGVVFSYVGFNFWFNFDPKETGPMEAPNFSPYTLILKEGLGLGNFNSPTGIDKFTYGDVKPTLKIKYGQ